MKVDSGCVRRHCARAVALKRERLGEQAQVSLKELGINTLFLALGMLHYRESRDSDIVLKAPLVLLPVQLERKSARSGYTLGPGDDDPLVNPALREYLHRSFGGGVTGSPRVRCHC